MWGIQKAKQLKTLDTGYEERFKVAKLDLRFCSKMCGLLTQLSAKAIYSRQI